MAANVTFSHNAARIIRIYINDTLHLLFSSEKLQGIQTWEMTTHQPPLYCIEITMANNHPILAEYASRELWNDIVSAIDTCFGSTGVTNLRHSI